MTPRPLSGALQSFDDEYLTLPRELPDTMRVLAIRVHFQPDTLSTTWGDGSFMYTVPDSIPDDEWVIDRPPHDRRYFLDHLLAARNYFTKFSGGALTLAGLRDPSEGGDVFPLYPLDSLPSYQLDYPVWHVNYGNDDHERLNETLVELFIDAWRAADDESDLTVADYDLFVVFHAGAGNEFDTGYDLTPHDIPSVYISAEDLATYGGLPDGIEMNDGRVHAGVILPETQRQPGVDVGLHGTVVAQIAFAIGLPHLYNTETGDAGIGMFGLMDRGFGSYFGLIPAPPSAWARVFMRWQTPVSADAAALIGDTVRVGALHLPEDNFGDDPGDLVRLLRLPINEDEYFLVEARRRDPDGDSLSHAYDRAGNRITFHDDYSWDAEDGFRVAVEYDDYDFDLPASGALVWHIDDSIIRAKYPEDALENDFDRRAVRLEEADGAWDIGREYAFLTPGDGSEYGWRDDAYYRNNPTWREANRPLFNPEFSTNTVPSSIANTGGYSHISLSRFSEIGDTMSFTVANSWLQPGFPIAFDENVLDLSTGDVDGDGADEIILLTQADGEGRVFLVEGDGGFVGGVNAPFAVFEARRGPLEMAIADFDGDGADEIAAISSQILVIADRDLDTGAVDVTPYPFTGGRGSLAVAEDSGGTPYLLVNQGRRISALQMGEPAPVLDEAVTFDPDFDTPFRSRMFVPEPGAGPGAADAVIWYGTLYAAEIDLDAMTVEVIDPLALAGNIDEIDRDEVYMVGAVGADFDGDGATEFIGRLSDARLVYWNYGRGSASRDDELGMAVFDAAVELSELRVADPDRDGLPEAIVHLPEARQVAGVERNGVLCEGSPVRLTGRVDAPMQQMARDALILDSDGDGRGEWVSVTDQRAAGARLTVAFNLDSGRLMPGFPLDVNGIDTLLAAGQIDDDEELELLVSVSAARQLAVYDLPSVAGAPSIVWGEPGGDRRNSGVVTLAGDDAAGTRTFAVDDAYCWPNPVLDGDIAHFRYPDLGASGELVVYDIAGREKLRARVTSGVGGVIGGEAEIAVDVSALSSGVYLARLEVGGEVKLIRFAVVN
ncbi:MAG: hypothetical protein MAG453_01716 [Calditrichaeota bacterium]|nr:hypothetical protein [Calditrichota bacterium]